MPGLFTQKPQRYAGVEVGQHAINVVELSQSRSGFELQAYAIEPLPTMALHDLTGDTAKSVAHVLSVALSKAGIQARSAAMSMPDTLVMCKTIQVETGLNEQDLELHVRLEAEHYVPYNLDDAALDFEVLGPCADDPYRTNVLLVVCRQQALEWHQSVLVQAGLRAKVIDVRDHAHARGLHWLSGVPGYQPDNPFAGVKIHPRLAPEALFCDAAQLLTACGLALRGFD